MVVTCEQMMGMEEWAFARGVLADDLMEEAGCGIARVVSQFSPEPGVLLLALGKGNNAGDALVAARELLVKGWKLKGRLAFGVKEFKPLPRKHWDRIAGQVELLRDCAELEEVGGNVVLLDGLLGIGVKGKVRGEIAAVIEEVNRLRERRHALVVAMDLPSGLSEDFGGVAIKADVTVTVGLVKSVLLEDGVTNFVGRLALVPLSELGVSPELGVLESDGLGKVESGVEVCFAPQLLRKLGKRDFDFHKGQAGRVGVVAGSRGMLGAAVLAARGALAGGAGLVTVYAAREIYDLLAVMMPEEVMVKEVTELVEVLDERMDVLVMGPGLGRVKQAEIVELMRGTAVPMVVDADGLNALAEAGVEMLDGIEQPVLLTPHPGEMLRLIVGRPQWQGLSRARLAREFAERFPRCVLLLKGSRTVIAQHGKVLAMNSTGSPGMASGGMGDVLSGLSGALMAGGMGAYDAACVGAWLSGRAAEIALLSGAASQESLSATVVAATLGKAFGSLKALEF